MRDLRKASGWDTKKISLIIIFLDLGKEKIGYYFQKREGSHKSWMCHGRGEETIQHLFFNCISIENFETCVTNGREVEHRPSLLPATTHEQPKSSVDSTWKFQCRHLETPKSSLKVRFWWQCWVGNEGLANWEGRIWGKSWKRRERGRARAAHDLEKGGNTFSESRNFILILSLNYQHLASIDKTIVTTLSTNNWFIITQLTNCAEYFCQ